MIDEKTKEGIAALSITELAALLKQTKEEHEALDRTAKDKKEIYEYLRLQVVPDKMDDMGVSSMNIDGIGRLGVTSDAYVSVKAGQKEMLYNWLKEHEFEDLIVPTVNGSTLKAFIKEQNGLGNPIPDDTIVNFTPYSRASITKK